MPSDAMAVAAPAEPRYRVGDVLFSPINRANLVPSLEAFFSARHPNNWVCVSNVHTTVECHRDARLRAIQNGSFLTIADGQPVIWYGRIAGAAGIERVMGPDIMSAVFAAPACRGRRHFFLGGAPGTLERMERNLRARFPDLIIAGTLSPPFRALSAEEDAAQRDAILATRPDYIWVCFGAPKQEYWMEANHARYPESLLIGIGAGFAYHAGELKRAPKWVQAIACEWVWRLAQDPKRLWKRYFKTNPVFMGMFAKRMALRALGK